MVLWWDWRKEEMDGIAEEIVDVIEMVAKVMMDIVCLKSVVSTLIDPNFQI